MDNIETLRDYFIADEIQRIYSLSPEEILKELVSMNTQKIELAPEKEILSRNKARNDN